MSNPDLGVAVRDLHDLYLVGRARQRRLRKVSRLITMATLTVFGAFLLAFYARATRMYALENFEGPFRKEAHTIALQLAPSLETLAEEAGPVCADLAVERFEDSVPQVRQAAVNEFRRLSRSLGVRTERQLNATLGRITKRNRDRLEEHFPSLTTPAGSEALKGKCRRIIEEDTEAIAGHFRKKHGQDVEMLRISLEGFQSDHFDSMEEDELSRYFAHLWLVRLDRLILKGDLGGQPDHE